MHGMPCMDASSNSNLLLPTHSYSLILSCQAHTHTPTHAYLYSHLYSHMHIDLKVIHHQLKIHLAFVWIEIKNTEPTLNGKHHSVSTAFRKIASAKPYLTDGTFTHVSTRAHTQSVCMSTPPLTTAQTLSSLRNRYIRSVRMLHYYTIRLSFLFLFHLPSWNLKCLSLKYIDRIKMTNSKSDICTLLSTTCVHYIPAKSLDFF